MVKNWLTWINYIVAALALVLFIAGLMVLFFRKAEVPVYNQPPPKTALPKRAFALPKEAYDDIGDPFLTLKFAPMSQQLPDLKKYLIYYGKNGRPDAAAEKPLLHFAFTGNKSISSVIPGEKLYILYDRKLNPPQYVFSPGNGEASLWMEAKAQNNEAVVHVSMKGENGEIINDPENNAEFTLPEKEFIRFGGAAPWEIGKNRVDATLLARQKAKWYGPDVFFELHGGKEYADFIGKQRIDFGEGDDIYSVYAGLNDALVWDHDRWKVVKPGVESLGKPLIVIKKVEDRLMNLELWDPEGKGKVILNLLKSSEMATPNTIIQQFKFVGARTRTQFVFEVNKERMLLSPHDWLLLTKDGWIKLTTPEEIDNYVNRKIVGPLFVFDEVERREDKQYLKGSLFNASRTEVQPVEIPLQQQTGPGPGHPGKGEEKPGQQSKPQNKPASIVNPLLSYRSDRDDDEDDDDMLDDDDDY